MLVAATLRAFVIVFCEPRELHQVAASYSVVSITVVVVVVNHLGNLGT